MIKAWNSIKKYLKVSDLVVRILFSLGMILVFRLASFVPVPGINSEVAEKYFAYLQSVSGLGSSIFQVVDAFSGGAFSQMTVFALGVGPYISASIFVQLIVTMMPDVQIELQEFPDVAQRKIASWTRYSALFLAFVQSLVFAKYALYMNTVFPGVISPHMFYLSTGSLVPSWMFFCVFAIVMSAGSLSLLWIAEQMSLHGIGNGISLIVSTGILASFPRTLYHALQFVKKPMYGWMSVAMSLWVKSVTLVVMLAIVTLAVLCLCLGQTNIPIMYARKTIGNKSFLGSGAPYIPLRLNYVGVIPIIFTSSILMFPGTLASFLGHWPWVSKLAWLLSPDGVVYMLLYVLMILFFSYFWTALQFNANKIVADMQRNGAFIPGIKQGRATVEFLSQQMQFVTLSGAIMLALVAAFPWICAKLFGIDKIVGYFLGGTSLLLVVGACLDTSRQIESFVLMQRYDGMMSSGQSKRKSKY